MDNELFKQTVERDKVLEVRVRRSDLDTQVRTFKPWAGTGGKKSRGNVKLFYWALRTEHQDLLLSEVLSKIFQAIKAAGFTHVEHALGKKKVVVPIESFQRKTTTIVPRSTIVGMRGATGAWGTSDDGSVTHHYVVGTAENGSKIAIDLGYTPYHPTPKTSSVDDEDNHSVSDFFKISLEEDLLEYISQSHKPADSTVKLETDAITKTPLFKQKSTVFFESFPLSSADLKNTGNEYFEAKHYHNSALWYSLGISFEESTKDSELIHVLYSNRSTAYYQLELFDEALEDAESAIRLAPQWPKGYLRKSAVLTALGREAEAQDVVEKMHQVENENSMPKK